MRARVLSNPDRYRTSFKDMAPSPGYGQRKVARERAKLPLLADLPGVILTAEQYQARMERINREKGEQLRNFTAKRWWAFRRWLHKATDEEFDQFRARWEKPWHVPHEAHYALDLARSINPAHLEEAAHA